MYKMILSDLDETLLVDHHVPPINQKAIAQLKDHGVKFVVATGRAFNMVHEILEEIQMAQQPHEYAICFNGGLIVENQNARILFFQGLPFQQAKALFEWGRRYDVCIMIFTLERCYLFNADPDEIARKTAQKAPFEVVDDMNMDFLEKEPIAKFLYMKKDMDYLKAIEKSLPTALQNQFSISYSSYRYLEFNPLGVSKGAALEWLADYLHIDRQDTIAIGDNYNDTSMIEAAGLGVCVPSASLDIQEKADYVTTADYDEGAVAEVIEKFVLMRGGYEDGI